MHALRQWPASGEMPSVPRHGTATLAAAHCDGSSARHVLFRGLCHDSSSSIAAPSLLGRLSIFCAPEGTPIIPRRGKLRGLDSNQGTLGNEPRALPLRHPPKALRSRQPDSNQRPPRGVTCGALSYELQRGTLRRRSRPEPIHVGWLAGRLLAGVPEVHPEKPRAYDEGEENQAGGPGQECRNRHRDDDGCHYDQHGPPMLAGFFFVNFFPPIPIGDAANQEMINAVPEPSGRAINLLVFPDC
jgi:hypothetical protein